MLVYYLHRLIRSNLFYIILIVFGISLHVLTAFYQPLALDEIASLFFSQTFTYGELLFKGGPEIIHPPIYYVVVKILFSLFQSVAVLRGFQFCLFFLMLFLLYLIGSEIAITKTRIFLLLTSWSLSPYILRVTYWLRMYTLAITFQLIATYLTLHYLKRPRATLLFWLLLIELLAFFTVYGSVFFIATQTIIAFYFYFKHRVRFSLFSSHVILLVSSLIYIFIILITNPEELQHHLSWVIQPTTGDIGYMFLYLAGFGEIFSQGIPSIMNGAIWYEILIVGLSLLLIILLWRMKTQVWHIAIQTKYIFAQTGILFLTFLGLSAFSAVYRTSFFHERQLFSLAVSLHMGIILIIYLIKQRFPTFGAVCVVTLIILYLIQLIHYLPPKFVYSDQGIWIDKDAAPYPKFGIYPDLVLTYHVCKAISFDNIVSKCKEQGITMVRDLSEVASHIGKGQPFSLLISDAYRGIFGEYNLKRFCEPHPTVSAMWNCNTQ